MTRSPGALSLVSFLPLLALAGCVAPPTSLGDPPESETETETSSDPDTDDPGGSGQVMTGDEADSGDDDVVTTTGTSTDDGNTSGDDDTTTGTSTDDGNTTGDPLDAAMVIFVNFDGVTLTQAAADDATLDQTAIAEMAGLPLEPFGDGPERDAIMSALAEYFSPFDVGVTATRPASGDYTMIVATPTNLFGGGVLGISLLDCDDANHRNVGFMFGRIGDPTTPEPEVVAAVIAHVVADTLGLEHTDDGGLTDPFDIESYTFTDACVEITNEPLCAAQHAPFGPAGQQSSFGSSRRGFRSDAMWRPRLTTSGRFW